MHFTYVIILGACVIGTLPLEFGLHTGVYRRWPQLLVALVPVVLVFGAWDGLAIHAGWWTYDPALVTGVTTLGRLPLEEVLFFVVIPTCAVLTFEAVPLYRPEWFAREPA
jgi:lycopene cyclase domain-containing protein